MSCEICFEDDKREVFTSTSCPHAYCKECWQGWFETCEKRRHGCGPRCPTCKVTVHSSVVDKALGRPFREPTSEPPQPQEAAEMVPDDLTLSTLQSIGAKQCPNCQIWIVREEGCQAMQCICGQRFCWTCGQTDRNGTDPTSGCLHVQTCHYYDNITHCELSRQIDVPVASPERMADSFRLYLESARITANYRQQYQIFLDKIQDEEKRRFTARRRIYGRSPRLSMPIQRKREFQRRLRRPNFGPGDELDGLMRRAFVDGLALQTNSRYFQCYQEWVRGREEHLAKWRANLYHAKSPRFRRNLHPWAFGEELDEMIALAFSIEALSSYKGK